MPCRCGSTVSSCDAAELAKQLKELADHPEVLSVLGARARAAFERRFDRPVAVRKWTQLLKSMD